MRNNTIFFTKTTIGVIIANLQAYRECNLESLVM